MKKAPPRKKGKAVRISGSTKPGRYPPSKRGKRKVTSKQTLQNRGYILHLTAEEKRLAKHQWEEHECQQCWICDGKSRKKLCLDHDHSIRVKNARGFVCQNCNKWVIPALEKARRKDIPIGPYYEKYLEGRLWKELMEDQITREEGL